MYKNRFYNLFGHFDPGFSFPIVLINGNSAGSQENHEIQEYNISYLGIFGSYIRGEQKENSDLDILVEFSKEPDLPEFIGLKQELSEILGV